MEESEVHWVAFRGAAEQRGCLMSFWIKITQLSQNTEMQPERIGFYYKLRSKTECSFEVCWDNAVKLRTVLNLILNVADIIELSSYQKICLLVTLQFLIVLLNFKKGQKWRHYVYKLFFSTLFIKLTWKKLHKLGHVVFSNTYHHHLTHKLFMVHTFLLWLHLYMYCILRILLLDMVNPSENDQ